MLKSARSQMQVHICGRLICSMISPGPDPEGKIMTFCQELRWCELAGPSPRCGIHVPDGSDYATGKIPQQGILLAKDERQRGVA
jgi:hypothetical protein